MIRKVLRFKFLDLGWFPFYYYWEKIILYDFLWKMFMFRFIHLLSKKFFYIDMYSFLSVSLSWKLLLSNSSKGIIVFWSFWYCFLWLLNFCITISYITSKLNVKAHAVPFDVGITIRRIPVRNNVIELVVLAIIPYVSIDFNIVVNISYFLFLFLFMASIFELKNPFFNCSYSSY